MVRKFIIGVTPGAPSPGTKTLSADFLGTCTVNYIFINCNMFDDLGDEPMFLQNTGASSLTTPDYNYQYGDRLVIDYTNFCPVQNECQPQ